ncbi:MAG: hypothetical protein HN341_14730 [Verrucomicrobia bacterium]|jgi:hypothetical protein|nr:hypothetical protein [Verrucomicrobiota bacterium]
MSIYEDDVQQQTTRRPAVGHPGIEASYNELVYLIPIVLRIREDREELYKLVGDPAVRKAVRELVEGNEGTGSYVLELDEVLTNNSCACGGPLLNTIPLMQLLDVCLEWARQHDIAPARYTTTAPLYGFHCTVCGFQG